MKVLDICCPGGPAKSFYTAEMPWAFILYKFGEGVPTVTLFEINKEEKKGLFEIVIMDKSVKKSAIKAVEVTIFVELLKKYMPGYKWKGSVRKEM